LETILIGEEKKEKESGDLLSVKIRFFKEL